jgi:hypothetical protein
VQANLKLFMSAVKMGDTDKVESWTSKGFDPNYQDVDSGGENVAHLLLCFVFK